MEHNWESNLTLLSEQWDQMKDDLYSGKVEYTDIKKLKEDYILYRVFDNLFRETKHFFEIPLNEIGPMYKGVRGAIDLNYTGRMVPNLEHAKYHNRMNPPGKAFLYAGVQNSKEEIIRTCLREIRAPLNSKATICQFDVTQAGKWKRVINLCGDSHLIALNEDELQHYIKLNAFDFKKGKMNKRKLSKILATIYINLFTSKEIFKPLDNNVDQDEKRREYAPFQAIAHYISESGYSGIMFNSTVYKPGKNLALFNPDLDAAVQPNTMEHINVSDFL